MAESDAPYRIEDEADYCLIELLPELNKAPWGEIDGIGTALLEHMQSRMEGSKRKAAFLVDLSPLNYMGSAMVALVVRLWKATKDKNAEMAVVNRDENVLEVLQLSGLTQVWTVVESREEGFKALGVPSRKSASKPDAAAAPSSQPAAQATPAPAEPKTQAAADAASGSARCGGAWSVTALILLGLSGAGLYLFTADNPPVEDRRITQGMLFGGGVLGLIAATAAASLGRGVARTAGVMCVLGCLALLTAGVYAHPQRDLILLPPDGKDHPSLESDETGENGPSSSQQSSGNKADMAPKPRKRPVAAPRPAGRSANATKTEHPDETSP